MPTRLVTNCTSVIRGFLRSRVGSQTSSLAFVFLASIGCLALATVGYLRREGAAIQFVRATYNTGLSFERLDWSPTALTITGLHFEPRRSDPDPQARCAPGKLFEAVEIAHVNTLTVQWGWRFLPEPTQVEFDGVRGTFSIETLREKTWPWLNSLPPSPPRTFAFVLKDCRPQLVDFLDAAGGPLATPPFDLTIGPEVNHEATVSLIVADRRAVNPISFRINYDGSGVANLQARNWHLDTERWEWVRAMLRQNAAAKSWWLRNEDGSTTTTLLDWAEANDLSGDFNCTLALALTGDRSELNSLSMQADISDLMLRRRAAADGEPQEIVIRGAVTLQAHCDAQRGGFQLDLGAGNQIRCNFDRADLPADRRQRLIWEDWMERNLDITLFRLAGSYRYRPEFERGPEQTPAIFKPLPESLRRRLTNLFACTMLEGAELRMGLKNSGELLLLVGQSDMRNYDATVTVRGPRTGPAAGSAAELHLRMTEPTVPTAAGQAPSPVPVTFEMTIDAERFPVPGRKDMVYTGRVRLEKGSFTRRWLSDLLLYRNLDIHPLATVPWLDPDLPQETLKVDRLVLEDGRLVAFGDLKFFVRNVNAVMNLHMHSLNPFQGWVNVQEVTGVQTGFGDHVVEFGPERLQGLMEFNLGRLTDDGKIDAWSDRGNNLEPANLFAVYLHSTADPENQWQFNYVLPWYMTRQRPGRMQVKHFPARLYPPGLNLGAGALLEVHEPIDWEMSCWLEPAAIGEAGAAVAPLTVLPENDALTAARLTQALVHHGLPGKRLLIVHRSLTAKGIQIQTSGQFEAQGLELPAVGDTKSFPYPRD